MNKVILIGRLTKDPETRYTQAAEPIAIARYSLAVNRRFKKEGEPDADFLNCVSFGKQAEFVEKYYKKGMQIAITGRISTRSFDDPATGQRRFVTEIIVEDSEFTESKVAYEARMAHNAEVSAERAAQQGINSSANHPISPQPLSKPISFEPEGFSAITESIDEDDLPF
ncbi:MAG: single-stranded DNA-binding protein [Defluviitaleaceae bacterium]|nr:single-stranded DNA-binding protein [Defluviitaleaceae bacterium]